MLNSSGFVRKEGILEWGNHAQMMADNGTRSVNRLLLHFSGGTPDITNVTYQLLEIPEFLVVERGNIPDGEVS